jgi:hypothetical protein
MVNTNPSPETRFKAGRSPNPGGRPRRKPITDALKAELERACRSDPEGRTNLEAGVRKLVDQFVAGVPHAQRLILAYVEGPPTQAIDVRGWVREFAEEHGLDADQLERDTWAIMRGGRP